MKPESSLTPLTKMNSKWIKDINTTTEAIKLLEETIVKKLLDIGVSNTFFGYDNKSTSYTTEYQELGLYQTKTLLHSKETINRMERQLIGWEKLSANHVLKG